MFYFRNFLFTTGVCMLNYFWVFKTLIFTSPKIIKLGVSEHVFFFLFPKGFSVSKEITKTKERQVPVCTILMDYHMKCILFLKYSQLGEDRLGSYTFWRFKKYNYRNVKKYNYRFYKIIEVTETDFYSHPRTNVLPPSSLIFTLFKFFFFLFFLCWSF